MKRSYEKPYVDLIIFKSEDIITASGAAGLTLGGESGKAESESFESLFGK